MRSGIRARRDVGASGTDVPGTMIVSASASASRRNGGRSSNSSPPTRGCSLHTRTRYAGSTLGARTRANVSQATPRSNGTTSGKARTATVCMAFEAVARIR